MCERFSNEHNETLKNAMLYYKYLVGKTIKLKYRGIVQVISKAKNGYNVLDLSTDQIMFMPYGSMIIDTDIV